MSRKLEMQKIPPKKKFPHFEAKSYDVPLCCFLKARKLDIETLETALNTSESVLSEGARTERANPFSSRPLRSTDFAFSNAVSSVSISNFLTLRKHYKGTSHDFECSFQAQEICR